MDYLWVALFMETPKKDGKKYGKTWMGSSDLRENHLGSVWTIFFGKKNPHFMDFNMGLPVLRETISSL